MPPILAIFYFLATMKSQTQKKGREIMPNGFDKLAEGIGDAIQAVPELYHDAFQPAVQESGKTLALVPKTINAALSPLRQWIALKEYNVAETEKLLAEKLKNIDSEKNCYSRTICCSSRFAGNFVQYEQ